MKRTLIIDGDIVLFCIGRATEDSSDFGDQLMESYDTESAIRLIDAELESICKKTGYKREELVFAITSPTNYRKKHFPTYKTNRKNIRKPLGLQAMRQHMLDNVEKYSTIMIEDLEADDVMGMYGTAPLEVLDGNEIAIYSQDKDLYTIPVKQWDFKKKKFIKPTMLQSLHFLYTQVLTGDAVDGYKGCPRIGKVKAAKALMNTKSELEMLAACHKLYFKAYGKNAKKELLIQIGQARILHYIDSQLLMQFDVTYDPYEFTGATDEMCRMWEEV